MLTCVRHAQIDRSNDRLASRRRRLCFEGIWRVSKEFEPIDRSIRVAHTPQANPMPSKPQPHVLCAASVAVPSAWFCTAPLSLVPKKRWQASNGPATQCMRLLILCVCVERPIAWYVMRPLPPVPFGRQSSSRAASRRRRPFWGLVVGRQLLGWCGKRGSQRGIGWLGYHRRHPKVDRSIDRANGMGWFGWGVARHTRD